MDQQAARRCAGQRSAIVAQVLPPMSLLGLQTQGGFYLGGSPIKMEYNAYISNGINMAGAAPTLNNLANLENMIGNTFAPISNDKMFGGRLGLWYPQLGLAGGISGMVNGDFVGSGFENSLNVWCVDLNYHKGNWDVAFRVWRDLSTDGELHRHQHSSSGALRPDRLSAA